MNNRGPTKRKCENKGFLFPTLSIIILVQGVPNILNEIIPLRPHQPKPSPLLYGILYTYGGFSTLRSNLFWWWLVVVMAKQGVEHPGQVKGPFLLQLYQLQLPSSLEMPCRGRESLLEPFRSHSLSLLLRRASSLSLLTPHPTPVLYDANVQPTSTTLVLGDY